jgi:septal ring factor EnvC (AmiA/AmiB activator)
MDVQVKLDNERLRLALVQATSNQKKFEEELHILKNNNMRLTNALQESHSNLDEWKKQLQFYKDECHRLKSSPLQNFNIGMWLLTSYQGFLLGKKQIFLEKKTTKMF